MIENSKLVEKAGGYAIIEDQNRVYFIDMRTHLFFIALFVFSLLAIITTLNGLVFIFINKVEVSAILATPALLSYLALYFFTRTRKRRERLASQLPVSEKCLLATVDLNTRLLSIKNTRIPLNEIRFDYLFSFTSSARPLAIIHGKEKYLLARGNPLIFVLKPFESYIDRLQKRINFETQPLA